MHARKGLAALVAVIAAVAIAVPVASASAATTPPTPATLLPPPGSVPGCPIWYGIPNPATGCTPYWVLAYVTVLRLYGTFGFPFLIPPLV
jgi:hypothetical protein